MFDLAGPFGLRDGLIGRRFQMAGDALPVLQEMKQVRAPGNSQLHLAGPGLDAQRVITAHVLKADTLGQQLQHQLNGTDGAWHCRRQNEHGAAEEGAVDGQDGPLRLATGWLKSQRLAQGLFAPGTQLVEELARNTILTCQGGRFSPRTGRVEHPQTQIHPS